MHNNFLFLKKSYPKLYENIFFAVKNVYEDSDTCLYKIRKASEDIVDLIIQKEELSIDLDKTYYEKLKILENKQLIDKEIAEFFHTIRLSGNKAVHGENGSIDLAKKNLFLIHNISCWFYRKYEDPKFRETKFLYLNYKYDIGDEVNYLEQNEKEIFNKTLDLIYRTIETLIIKDKLMGFGFVHEIENMSFYEYQDFFEKAINMIANMNVENNEGVYLILEFKKISRKIYKYSNDVEVLKNVAIMIYNRTHWSQAL